MAFDFPSSPTTGQIYSPTNGPSYVWSGTAWRTVGPGSQFNRAVFTATANQTTFSAPYVIGAFDVFRNGVKLAAADFTATNGTSIVLNNPCAAGDTIEVIAYPQITYADAVKRTGDTMTGALAVPSLTVNSVPVLAGPAFRAYYNTGAATVTSSVLTKTPFNAETFDTANCFDSTTNYRFTPNVAGYYLLNGTLYASATGGYLGQAYPAIYKNGSQVAIGNTIGFNGNYTGGMFVTVSDIFYANGSSDYFEIYAYLVGSGTLAVNGSSTGTSSTFSGCMVRAA